MKLILLIFVGSAFFVGCSTAPKNWTTKSEIGPWNKSESCNFEARSGDYYVFGTYYTTVSQQPACTSTTCSYRNQTNRTYSDTKRFAGFYFVYDIDTAITREGYIENFPPTPLSVSPSSVLNTNPSGDFARFKLSLITSSNQSRLTLAMPADLTWELATEISPSNDVVFRINHTGSPTLFERDARIWSWRTPIASNEAAGTYASLNMKADDGPANILEILAGSDTNYLSISDRETDSIIYRARLPRLSDPVLNETFLRWDAALETCSY
ncbi:MAG: hypothetical protein AAFZ74_17865 [Pseudomonadota bacterium]